MYTFTISHWHQNTKKITSSPLLLYPFPSLNWLLTSVLNAKPRLCHCLIMIYSFDLLLYISQISEILWHFTLFVLFIFLNIITIISSSIQVAENCKISSFLIVAWYSIVYSFFIHSLNIGLDIWVDSIFWLLYS